MWLRDRRVRVLVTALLGLILVYIAYWLLQSPVPSGMYPARVGGTYYSTDSTPTYDLPIIWVRPFPWSKDLPVLNYLALVTADGEQAITRGDWMPPLAWDSRRPAWLQPRAIPGVVSFHYPKEGLRANGVTWKLVDEEKRLFWTGEITLAVADLDYTNPMSWGTSVETEGRDFGLNGKNVVGHYISIFGPGRLIDIIPSTAGSEHPISGLLYRDGELLDMFNDAGTAFRPLLFPHELSDAFITVYMPLNKIAQERLHDTLYYFRPTVVIEDPSGIRYTVQFPNSTRAFLGSRRPEWEAFIVSHSEPQISSSRP